MHITSRGGEKERGCSLCKNSQFSKLPLNAKKAESNAICHLREDGSDEELHHSTRK